MDFFIYENWQASDNNGPTIHIGSCGHCNNGQGKHSATSKGENGVWIGPFSKKDYVLAYYLKKFNKEDVSFCRCCSK
jgi:hypothetical protein